MNRLNKQRAYLAGAIDREADRGKGWRDNITPFLNNLGVTVFNPLIKPGEIGKEDENTSSLKKQLKKERRYDELYKVMKAIRGVDLRLVDISDFLIVNLEIQTILIVFKGKRKLGLGENLFVSTAFGIVKQI